MLFLDSAAQVCADTSFIWQLIGKVYFVFKIAIPLLIIILGSIDLGKAVVASDDKKIKEAAKSLLFRFIAGLIIFFLPQIIALGFKLADNTEDYSVCLNSLQHPWSSSDND